MSDNGSRSEARVILAALLAKTKISQITREQIICRFGDSGCGLDRFFEALRYLEGCVGFHTEVIFLRTDYSAHSQNDAYKAAVFFIQETIPKLYGLLLGVYELPSCLGESGNVRFSAYDENRKIIVFDAVMVGMLPPMKVMLGGEAVLRLFMEDCIALLDELGTLIVSLPTGERQ